MYSISYFVIKINNYFLIELSTDTKGYFMRVCASFSGVSDSSDIGYTPLQIRNAYNFGNDEFDGLNITVSVIDFIGNSYLQNNIDIFSERFALPKVTLNIIGERVNNTFDFAAYIEPSIDTQWVHAIAPFVNINVIRAGSFSPEGAIEAISKAYDYGTDIILLTFQSAFRNEYVEYSDVFSRDCIYVVSAGDYGAQANFPACFPQCTSVGATEVMLGKAGERLSEETVWENTGGGICEFFSIPDFQREMSGISEITDNMRGVPDIAFTGSSKYGVSVYHSSVSDTFGWYNTGGTSVSASIAAGVIARIIAKEKIPRSRYRNINKYLYSLAGGTAYSNPYGKFLDITKGNNGTYSARVGYDLCSGLGALKNI